LFAIYPSCPATDLWDKISSTEAGSISSSL
jgi:hypothetical protein